MTPAFKRLLFPVDFSERCSQTAPYVARIARKFNSRVFLLYAADLTTMLYSGPEPSTATLFEYQKQLEKECWEELDRFGQEAFSDLPVTRIVIAEDPGRAITDCAAENNIDLIVMPTHGRGAFRHLLLGSITSKVLHDSSCAVLTTAHSETLADQSEDLRIIVCAVDLGPENLHVITEASEVAHAYGATVRLVHAVPALQPAPEFPIDPDLAEGREEHARQRLNELQRQCGVHWEIFVQTADVAQAVRQAAGDCGAGSVVIGRSRPHHHFGGLRTHVSSIIRESPCPVLSVPERI